MVVPHPGFRRKVAEHVGLLLILSSHHNIRRSKHSDRNLFQGFFRILLELADTDDARRWGVAGRSPTRYLRLAERARAARGAGNRRPRRMYVSSRGPSKKG